MTRRVRWITIFLLIAGAVFAGTGGYRLWSNHRLNSRGNRTVAEVIQQVRPAAEARLRPCFDQAGVPWPPPRAAFVAFKEEKRLELWAAKDGRWVFIRAYPILAASGRAGPKLREGDGQVPEGIYRIVGLNPNSRFHLSLELNYPNDFDRHKAAEDGRSNLGGEIFIHGKAVSIGCLAMGDEGIEDLFTLVHAVGLDNVQVLIAPRDLRGGQPPADLPTEPPWADELYATLRRQLQTFALPPAPSSSGVMPQNV